MTKEAIVLCGGLGTRLRSVIKDIPKPMASIANKPFLCYIFEYLLEQNITKVVLAVSYKFEVIQDYFGLNFKDLELIYSIEKTPLGTGGAIKAALEFVQNDCYVLNGDTYFPINLNNLHLQDSKICLALKQMYDFNRYGVVSVDNDKILGFCEKTFTKSGLINGGIYKVSKNLFDDFKCENAFSFEEFLQKNFNKLKARAEIFNEDFIDIGIPEDYFRFNALKSNL